MSASLRSKSAAAKSANGGKRVHRSGHKPASFYDGERMVIDARGRASVKVADTTVDVPDASTARVIQIEGDDVSVSLGPSSPSSPRSYSPIPECEGRGCGNCSWCCDGPQPGSEYDPIVVSSEDEAEEERPAPKKKKATLVIDMTMDEDDAVDPRSTQEILEEAERKRQAKIAINKALIAAEAPIFCAEVQASERRVAAALPKSAPLVPETQPDTSASPSYAPTDIDYCPARDESTRLFTVTYVKHKISGRKVLALKVANCTCDDKRHNDRKGEADIVDFVDPRWDPLMYDMSLI